MFPENAFSAILDTYFGMNIFVNAVPISATLSILTSCDSGSIFKVCRCPHQARQYPLKCFTEFGTLRAENGQLWKINPDNSLRLGGRITSVSIRQLVNAFSPIYVRN